jgi:hypothetical protein
MIHMRLKRQYERCRAPLSAAVALGSVVFRRALALLLPLQRSAPD